VVRHAEDLDALEPGEVLVCEATSPSWGYAFTLAAAVVCDTGGPTTHAAICSRERGIPCVVSAHGATRFLDDGDWVEVDGATGTVTLTT
jgi:rifampicin phosphotransferase